MYKPVSYLQTDSRWGSISYSAKGESTTIAASGCGPTAMSMVLATWADKNVTPKTECAWALAHGYKAPHSGTYYGYFVPAGKRYGLTVTQLNGANIYGNSTSTYHAQAKQAIDSGCLVIACMGKGTWTSSGHYVLVYNIQGNTIYINDPASTRAIRTQGDYSTFKKQVKYYWVIKPPKGAQTQTTTTKPTQTTTPKKEELDMTKSEFLASLTDAEAFELVTKAMRHAGAQPEPEWSKKEGHWQRATNAGIVDGTRPEGYIRRDELTAVLGRKGLL